LPSDRLTLDATANESDETYSMSTDCGSLENSVNFIWTVGQCGNRGIQSQMSSFENRGQSSRHSSQSERCTDREQLVDETELFSKSTCSHNATALVSRVTLSVIVQNVVDVTFLVRINRASVIVAFHQFRLRKVRKLADNVESRLLFKPINLFSKRRQLYFVFLLLNHWSQTEESCWKLTPFAAITFTMYLTGFVLTAISALIKPWTYLVGVVPSFSV
jgi:hypothetical protein